MVRTLDIVMVAALIATAGWTFKVKHDAEKSVSRVEALETQIRLEREAIDILKADWGLLTSPDRLEKLVIRHSQELGLGPLQPRQITTIDKVPHKLPDILPAIDEDSAAVASDPANVTGSVKRQQDEQAGEEIE